jgi:hypothetical protein
MQLVFSVGKNVLFVDEFLPHGLFALDTLRESKIRAPLLGRICRLLRDSVTYRIDV